MNRGGERGTCQRTKKIGHGGMEQEVKSVGISPKAWLIAVWERSLVCTWSRAKGSEN